MTNIVNIIMNFNLPNLNNMFEFFRINISKSFEF